MEARKDPPGPDLPAASIFTHTPTSPFVEDLIQGLVGDAGSSPGQINFGWSPYSEASQYQQGAFPGWNSFEPTLDLNGPPSTQVPSSAYHEYEEYLRSLSTQGSASADNAGVSDEVFRVYNNASNSFLGGHDIQMPDQSGRSLYEEALTQLSNFSGKEYEPFGMNNVFNPSNVVNSDYEVQESLGADSNANVSGSSTSSSSRPSYSEVARNNPSGDQPKAKQSTSPDGSSTSGKFPDAASSSHGRHKRPKSFSFHGVSKHASGPSPTKVKPNSRMGLDRFEDVANLPGTSRKSTGADDTSNPSRSRKGSTSSMGSGSSGMEDLTYFIQSKAPCVNREGSPASATGGTSSCDGIASDKLDATDEPAMTPVSRAKVKTNRRHSRPRAESSPTTVQEKNTKKTASTDKKQTGSETTTSKQGPFFDPKRIFGDKEVKDVNKKNKSATVENSGHIPNNQNQGHDKEKTPTNLLNNDKPQTNFMYTTSNPGKPATTHYINNDLRQSANKKMTNTEGRNSPNRGPNKSTNTHRHSEVQTDATIDEDLEIPISGSPQPPDPPQPPPNQSTFPGGRRKHDGKKSSDSRPYGKRSRRHRDHNSNTKGELVEHMWEWCKWTCSEVTQHAVSILLLVLKVGLALSLVALSGIFSGCHKAWSWLRSKLPFIKPAASSQEEDESYDWSNPNSQSRYRTMGLEKNMPLPTTGEEAMKRLLACKGKDPYSILGVRSDSTDEEIKKYYRKQAVLVHPDKNKIPGAEEAFKILGHSFELIGEPEKRSKYDSQRLETQETETAMHEFADLLSKLHDKMQEAANLMRCELCGGKHRRVPTERPWYNARYCDRCNVRHSAKEGDVWAESRVMGFLWHYYACMEGKIYDITEWASCQRGNFKHIQANAHHVIYRIATQANARQRAQTNPGQRANGEADLEDFINHLFQRSGRSDSTNGADPSHAHPGNTQPATNPNAPPNNAAKKRKKKKKH